MAMQKLKRIHERDNVILALVVDPVNEAGECCGLTASGGKDRIHIRKIAACYVLSFVIIVSDVVDDVVIHVCDNIKIRIGGGCKRRGLADDG